MQKINTNMASEFWFYSQLHRLGYESYITLGNSKAIDIVVILNDKEKTRLTFDVKGKESFVSGSYQFLPKYKTTNHFFVFIGLQIKKNSNSKKIEIFDDIECYLIEAKNLHMVAFNWVSSSGKTKGYGFEPKILKYIKSNGKTKLSNTVMSRLLNTHQLKSLDFKKYNKIVMTLEQFESKYYKFK